MRKAKALLLNVERAIGVDHVSGIAVGRTITILIIANLFAAALLYLVYLVF